MMEVVQDTHFPLIVNMARRFSIMASEIKVDTIVNAGGDNDTGIDLATNDQILLKVANATKLTMNSTGQTTIVGEGGTTTTSVQQGWVKHWCIDC